MFSTVKSASVDGLDVQLISVEADVRNGLPSFQMVGYLSSEVREAGERVRTAVQNAGFSMRPVRIVINLSPGDLRKRGTAFDLPIAVAVLKAFGCIPQKALENALIIGELGLNGDVHKVPGVFPVVMEAKKKKISCCIVPYENQKEGAMIGGIPVIGIKNIREVQKLADQSLQPDGFLDLEPIGREDLLELLWKEEQCNEDFREIAGQEFVKRAIEIAVAGGHNLLMSGPPGIGKSMMAQRIPSILPDMTLEESLEISKIYSIKGLLNEENPIVSKRPFREVPHTITRAALIGGGIRPGPGEVSLSSGGVLFLDEISEMDRSVIESLRQPLEEHKVYLTRSFGSYVFPADFLLVAATNPCPCGNYPDRNRCKCSDAEIRRYRGKLSRPFMERVDLFVEVDAVPYEDVKKRKEGRSSGEMRERIIAARKRQEERYRNETYKLNGRMNGKGLERYCHLTPECEKFMEQIYTKMHLSVRTYHKILKVARTIADLEEGGEISLSHLQEAAGYRNCEPEE